MKQKSGNKVKRWLIGLGGGAVVLCLAACGFWYWINITPQVDIPTPVMPHTNGYDFFLRANAAYVDDSKGVDEKTDHIFMPGKQYPVAAKEAWLKQNARALQLLREGLKYPALHPPVRSESSFREYRLLRGQARALVVESHVRAERGDWNGAVDSVLDDVKLGNEIPRGAPLIGGLVGIAVRIISLTELGNLVSHTSAITAKKTAARMEELYGERFPYSETLQEEKWLQQAQNLQIMSEPSWRLNIVRNPDSSLSWLKRGEILVISKRKVLNDCTKMMDAYIANANRPYTMAQPVHTFGDPLVDDFLPVFNKARWNWARGDTFSVLIMTMFALRAYQMDNGHYPANLQKLVPQYLKKVPLDPFADNTFLQYRLQGQKYALWSIGADGVDNHGTPIINRNYSKRARYRLLSPDDKGDVVAGINTR